MKFLRNLRVASRLAIGFGVLATIMVGLGIFGITRLARVNNQLDTVANVRFANVQHIEGMLKILLHNTRLRFQQFFETSPTELAKLSEQQKTNTQTTRANVKWLEENLKEEKERAALEDVKAKLNNFVVIRDKMLVQYDSGQKDAAVKILIAEVLPAQDTYTATLERFQAAEQELAEAAAKEGADVYRTTRTLTLIVIVLAMAIAAAIAFVITNSITRPLVSAVAEAGKIAEGRFKMESNEELGQVTEAFGFVQMVLAETVDLKDRVQRENAELQANIMDLLAVVADASDGDLTVRAKVTTGALGNVADAFNSLVEALQALIGRVADQIDKTNGTIKEISDSSNQMASGATTQATEVDAAKSLVAKTAEDIKRMGQAAESAADAARNTQSSAHEGATAIENIISGMEQLRQNVQAGAKKMKNLGDRSMEITGIVDTISRISEQTNMLALNAAIEAARAGEHGRGFSVVAEEVRKLAERTATATQEIAKLVTAIHHETNETVAAIEKQTQVVEQESALVSRAGKALLKIRDVSAESANLVTGISSLTKAQIEGSAVVGKAISQISEIAQATLRGVEGTVSNLGQLTSLSSELSQSMSRFKVN